MATTLTRFEVDQAAINGNVGTLYFSFTTPVNGLELKDFLSQGVSLSNLASVDGINWTATVTPTPGYTGRASIILLGNSFTNAVDGTNGSGKQYSFVISPPVPVTSVSFESTGSDAVYNANEVGPDGTITAKISVDANTKVGDILTVNGQRFTLSADQLSNGVLVEVLPGTVVTTSITNAYGPGPVSSVVAPPADLIGPINTLTINPITADNIVNAAESNDVVTITGTVTGEYQPTDLVTLQVNGKIYSTTVDANGQYSVEVSGSDLTADIANAIQATLVAHDVAGNETSTVVTRQYVSDVEPIAAPVVTITSDADNDGVVRYNETSGKVSYTISLSSGTAVGDTLVVNGRSIEVTSQMLTDGYTASVPVKTGDDVSVVAYVKDTAGNRSPEASDTAKIDLTLPDANPLYLYHLGANLDQNSTIKDAYGKTGSSTNYRTTDINDHIFIGFSGTDANGKLITSPSDGDFERDLCDGDRIWTLNTGKGNDTVQIREDQNAYTVTKLGEGNDTYAAGGGIDATCASAWDDNARAYVFAESGNDVIVAGGYLTGKVTGWGVTGGRIFAGSGNDTVTVYGNVNEGAVIDLGSGSMKYAAGHQEAASADTAEAVNVLKITGELGECGRDDFGYVIGGLGKDLVTIQGEVEGYSKIMLAEGEDVLSLTKLTGDAVADLGDGNDAVTVNEIWCDAQIVAGNGDDVITVNSKISVGCSDTAIFAGNGNDTIVFNGKNVDGIINGGAGQDTLILNYTQDKSLVNSCLNITNVQSSDIKGIEVINMQGLNAVDLRYSDLVADTTREGALKIQGTAGSKVDLGANNLNSDTAAHANLQDVNCGSWSKTGSTTADGVAYDIYHYSAAGSSTVNDVYIQQGVTVI